MFIIIYIAQGLYVHNYPYDLWSFEVVGEYNDPRIWQYIKILQKAYRRRCIEKSDQGQPFYLSGK